MSEGESPHPSLVVLPARSRQAEDAFVQQLSDHDEVELLVDAVEAALGERRPTLAARLVQLLPATQADPDGHLARARQAARLVLSSTLTAAEQAFSELEDAWSQLRRDRMWRIKTRMRRSQNAGSPQRVGRLDGRRRRR